ncbi:MAG: aminopeptidase P family protein [Mycobacteriales bacterium]
MPEVHAARRARLVDVMAEHEVDAMLVTRLLNVRYLSGFSGSNGALLVTSDAAVLATDGRYITQSSMESPDLERLIGRGIMSPLVARAGELGIPRLGFEAHEMTVEQHTALSAIATSQLMAAGRPVEALRQVKDDDEVAALREACAIGDRAFAALLPQITAGRTERELAVALEGLMRGEGGDGPSFETIVATGPHSAIPHHRPTDRVVERGDFVKFDFGSLYRGYHADMTRTVVVGEPADWQREIYDVVRRAQQLGVDALAVGVSTGDIDAASREVIEAAGYGEYFTHSLGHGVGLEIHEAPTLSAGGSDRLADRTPVTVEPGIYLEGRGGVRIEDTLVVRESGTELLTTTSKDLLVL